MSSSWASAGAEDSGASWAATAASAVAATEPMVGKKLQREKDKGLEEGVRISLAGVTLRGQWGNLRVEGFSGHNEKRARREGGERRGRRSLVDLADKSRELTSR